MHDNIKRKFNEQSGSAPRITQYKGHSVHVVDGQNPQSLNLLSKAYNDVYRPAFPMPLERESLDVFLAELTKDPSRSSIVISIVGDKLDTETPVIKGMAVGYYYAQEDVGLLAYIATSPESRSKGMGSVMNDSIKQALLDIAKSNNAPLKGIFIECHDPEKIKPEEDSIHPSTRLSIFQKWQAKIIPIDYVQPPLDSGKNKCDAFKLLAYPHPVTGEYPSPDAVKSFVHGIYSALARYSPCAPQEDPDYINIMRQVKEMKPLNDNRPEKKPHQPPSL